MVDQSTFKVPYFECGPGWKKLIDPLVDYCRENNVKITQIKEKFGGLRFYTGAAPDEFHAMVHKAEEESFHTCEECGEPGERRGKTWLKTTCERHKPNVI